MQTRENTSRRQLEDRARAVRATFAGRPIETPINIPQQPGVRLRSVIATGEWIQAGECAVGRDLEHDAEAISAEAVSCSIKRAIGTLRQFREQGSAVIAARERVQRINQATRSRLEDRSIARSTTLEGGTVEISIRSLGQPCVRDGPIVAARK